MPNPRLHLMQSGIYEVVNTTNGKTYVGSAVNFVQRFGQHRWELRGGHHFNRHLQSAWKKYGEKSFVFSVIEYVSEQNLIEREQHWIDGYNVVDEGYNEAPVAGSSLGRRNTPEAKKRMSEAQLRAGNRHTEEHKRKIGDALRGRSPTPQARANHAATQKRGAEHHMTGRKLSAETRAKVAAAGVGRPKGKETREKLRQANLGENNPNYGKSPSEETRAKQSKATSGEKNWCYGKKLTEDHRSKLSASHWTKSPQYEEIKARQQKTLAATIARKKAEREGCDE